MSRVLFEREGVPDYGPPSHRWLHDVLTRMAGGHSTDRIEELLPCRWTQAGRFIILGLMEAKTVNAPEAPAAAGGYAQAVEVAGASRLLFVSGQVPLTAAGELPATFRDQCRLAWHNVEAQLRAAGMELDNLVKVTTFLSSRDFAAENRDVRQEVLGDRSPALTVIITGIFDQAWLVEIEAVAAA